ncbi:forespore capture DNA-binding protein RefZ [Neobacillus sp. MM2021_6]|uniref:forespore capture DNA-binding protein RefZ n=1 Tax=Bacillaceae TaxID=186817 RepID=UPI00140C87CB|nr:MULTISPECIES: forespore capture DNA-binding protein RefZ [Bacillaceae]MBO0960067.1 forespore capture DNA-binding protein RefZ [Neobacillus sp. MM2021_6]NHC17477.1 forespore capture DNA-binding protein RefZ [Bacillus sp. MM2020_4]
MKKNAKDAIVKAAISLFNTNGYSGTSIRDIASLAKVNTAAIAYHFHNKPGLLEYCFMHFFEQYMSKIEGAYASIDRGAKECLKKIAADLLHFQSENIQLTSFVYREMSMDSQVVREIMSTYSLKEKYYFQQIFERGFEWNEFRPHSIPYLIIQLKSFLMMPYMNNHYMREVLYIFPNEPFFEQKYLKDIHFWIDKTLCSDLSIKKGAIIK